MLLFNVICVSAVVSLYWHHLSFVNSTQKVNVLKCTSSACLLLFLCLSLTQNGTFLNDRASNSLTQQLTFMTAWEWKKGALTAVRSTKVIDLLSSLCLMAPHNWQTSEKREKPGGCDHRRLTSKTPNLLDRSGLPPQRAVLDQLYCTMVNLYIYLCQPTTHRSRLHTQDSDGSRSCELYLSTNLSVSPSLSSSLSSQSSFTHFPIVVIA